MQKQRRFRSKPAAVADDDDAGAAAASAAQLAARRAEGARKARQQERRKADVVTKASLLSFEDDEEGAVPAPAPSRTVRAQAAPAPRDERTSNTQRSAPGEYSSERLQQLRQQTKTMPGVAVAEPVAAGGFKLSGSFKAAKKPVDDRFEVNASDLMKMPPPKHPDQVPFLPPPARDAKRGAPAAPEPLPPAAAPAKAALPVAANDSDPEDEANGFSIPTADAIRRAKEKRERLRSAHLAPDYVPLGGVAALLSNQDAAARLRGERGEDSVPAGAGDSDDDAEAGSDMRMQFVGGSGGKQAGRGGVFASLDAEAGGDGDEDEDDAWVRQQLQKAGASDIARARGLQPEPAGAGGGAWGTAAGRAPAQALNPAAQAAAAGRSVMNSLQEGLRRLQEKQQHVERQRKQTAAKLADSLQSISRLEGEVATASHRYTYLQEMRGFIADMCDMLQAKAPIVEVLEERLLKAASDRADAAAAAEAADDREELEAAQAAVGAAIGVLSRGGALPAAQQAAEAAAAAADAAAVQNLPEALDEFGRDTNVEKRRQAEERLVKRNVQRAAGEAQLAGDASDEDAGDVSHYERESAQILEAAATVFADASEDYSTVTAVKQRLEDWQTSYPAAYRDAYMAVSAPAIFAPFVRQELLRWDPLFNGSRGGGGFDSHDWYQQLFEFSAPPAANSSEPDEDADVVPVLVRNIVAPLALHLAERVWDPASRTQTRGMFSIVENLLIYLPTETTILQDVLRMVRQRLAESVSRAAVPRWPGEALAASPRAAAFVGRQFSRAVRLLGALSAFEDLLQPGAFQQLAVDQLLLQQVALSSAFGVEDLLQPGAFQQLAVDRLLQQILPLLRSKTNDVPAALALAERVASALPASWSRQGTPKEAAPLATLVEDLHRRAQASRKSDPAHVQRLAALSAKLSTGLQRR